MKKEFVNLQEVAQELGDGGDFNPDTEYKTVRELLDDLVELGNTDKVHPFHDDHEFVENDLSNDFLKSSLDELDVDKFEEEIEIILEQANEIIARAHKELTEDDIEDIKEYKMMRGEDIED